MKIAYTSDLYRPPAKSLRALSVIVQFAANVRTIAGTPKAQEWKTRHWKMRGEKYGKR